MNKVENMKNLSERSGSQDKPRDRKLTQQEQNNEPKPVRDMDSGDCNEVQCI